MEKAGFVEVADIASAEVFFAADFDKGFFGFFGLIEIAFHDRESANDDFAVFTEWGFFAGFEVDDDDFVIGDRVADAVGIFSDGARREDEATRSFGEAVAVFNDSFGAVSFKEIVDFFFVGHANHIATGDDEFDVA